MDSQNPKVANRSCCKKNCFEKVEPLKLKNESRRDTVLKYVKVYPCKTRKVKDRFRPKNCYREYFLPGHHSNDVKVCKNVFMSTVKCSSDFIGKTLYEVTKAITDNQEDAVTTLDYNHQRNRFNTQQTVEINQVSFIKQKGQGFSNIPLMVEEINQGEVSSHETDVSSHETDVSSHEMDVSSHETDVSSHETEVSSHETEKSSHETEVKQHETGVSSHKTGVSMHETVELPNNETDEDFESFDLLSGHENFMNDIEEITDERAFEAVNYLEDEIIFVLQSAKIPSEENNNCSSRILNAGVVLGTVVMCFALLFVKTEQLYMEMLCVLFLCACFIYISYRIVCLFVHLTVTLCKILLKQSRDIKNVLLFYVI